MKNMLTILKKELKRFFTDKRYICALFLPGVILFIFYTIMGNMISSSITSSSSAPTNTVFNVAYSDNSGLETPLIITSLDASIRKSDSTNSVSSTAMTIAEAEELKDSISASEYDLLFIFTDDFEKNIYDSSTTGNNISIYYNGKTKESSYIYSLANALVSGVYDNYTVNYENGIYQEPNRGESDYMMNNVMGIVFPIVTISLLFSAIISICPEAIAGEKERGTMSSLLLTSSSRTSIAVGKLLAVMITSLASGLISFVGIILSLPNLVGAANITFTAGSIIALLFMILTALILLSTMGLLISAFSKTIKEASSYLGPLMMLFLILGIIPAFVDMSSIGFAFIPFVNIAASMNIAITQLDNAISIPYMGVTIGMNLLVSGLMIYLITKAFNNEKIMMR